MKISIISISALLLLCLFSISGFAQKMKPEEVVSKHLDSIASAEKRASLKSLMSVGDMSVKFISQKNQSIAGRAVLASSGGKLFFGMNMSAVDYPSEKFSFNGDKAKVAFVINSIRSPLGNFLLSNGLIIEESLLGGALSTSWALHNLADKKAKISSDGMKKIDGKEVYVLSYTRKGGADVDVSLFFDKETFRHVRTEYKRTASAAMGRTIDQSARQSETRFRLTENYSDFKNIDGITLPQTYTIIYSTTGQNGTTEIEWAINLTEFAFNQNFPDSTFDVDVTEKAQ